MIYFIWGQRHVLSNSVGESGDGVGRCGERKGRILGFLRVGSGPTVRLGIACLGCFQEPDAIDWDNDDVEDVVSREYQ